MKKEYNTINDNDGKNYRDIAQIMSKLGFKMNHSSVRNYIIRIMKKFAQAYVAKHNIDLSLVSLSTIAQSNAFQQGIADILHVINSDIYTKGNNHVKCNIEESA